MEVPDQFAIWTGLSGVSCATGRNVFLKFGVLTIFPNLYVCLIAGSGQKKSTAIEQLEPILYSMEPRPNLIAQKITPEALIEAMRTHESSDTKHLLREKAQGFVLLDELTSLMTQTTYEGLNPLLLQFYNCKKEFSYKTKTAGETTLKETCLGFLAATTPASLSRAIPDSAIGDGLTARINFIYSKNPVPLVPIPYDSPRKRELRDRLGRSIARIGMLKGELKLSDDAQELCVKDYIEMRTDKQSQLNTNPLLHGYANRHQVHCLKVAMLLCCAEGATTTVTAEHMETSIGLVKLYETDLPDLVALVSSSEHGLATHQILEIMRSLNGVKQITRQDILQKVSNRLSSRELDSVIETLERAGFVKTLLGPPLHYHVLKP